jgi:hypothetical protein
MDKQTQETQQLGIQPTDEDLSIYPMVRRSKELRSLIPEGSSITFFIHVPKTGGTDLAIKLQDSECYNVFSLDAPENDYRQQVDSFNPKRPTFIRAHIYILDAWFNFLKGLENVDIFTILRNPYSLHVSLATMIYERREHEAHELLDAITDQCSQQDFEITVNKILDSHDYGIKYKDIYTKYFSYALENTPLMDRLRVITIDQVDSFQDKLLPGHSVLNKPRLNQSHNKISYSASALLSSGLIISLSKLISGTEIRIYEQLLQKASE